MKKLKSALLFPLHILAAIWLVFRIGKMVMIHNSIGLQDMMEDLTYPLNDEMGETYQTEETDPHILRMFGDSSRYSTSYDLHADPIGI